MFRDNEVWVEFRLSLGGSERGEKEYIFIHGKDYRLSNAKRKVKELFERREKAFIHRL